MKNIKDIELKKVNYPVKVIQFGEGNFLRAFIEWQIQQMNNKGLFKGSVALVQPIERGMIDRLDEQNNNYTVVLEGLLEGKKVQSDEIITAIDRTINPYKNFENYLKLADIESAEFIFSNTTEAGIAYNANDKLEDKPAKTYPAKLTQLLYRRFENKMSGFQIVPCELIEHNGDSLKRIVLQYAHLWNLGDKFVAWINNENSFYSTLVDRIVPGFPRDNKEEVFERIGYEDNMLVKAEAFLLFVIEGDKKLEEVLPLKKAGLNVIVTDDMQPYRERKVRLLNGPHTTMAPLALLAGVETVGDVMKDVDFLQFINDEMYDEISPMIALPKEELAMYVEAIKERFNNPFVRHELTSIALNSMSKCEYRLLPTIIQNIERTGKVPERITLAFSAWLYIYGPYGQTAVEPQDTPDVMTALEKMKKSDDFVTAVLGYEAFWGCDLTKYPELVAQVKKNIDDIQEVGTRALVKKINESK
ncbi:tagaturonate reductase [Lactococcus lactis]|uniref:Altronate oxidoreductase n=1 Tax=Lactococcus lactis subsp. lactis A12 TaxID=1137134 RepID=S6FS14_LACLL|nr:tagaturonate reductase [Lactococcus lactis]KST85783.1 Altronate oxidoreductase [Lactococcus lactis subsp. lactis]MDU0404212.1 Altronate oxidoreductase [Lactococcus lactis]CDG03897.1 Putative altronate oxidoreductase [Lactococcus lactis subsp. lactis A12]SBW30949.1 Putative altronate oxidoreductase [Lactococcus lactis subsp. lactis]